MIAASFPIVIDGVGLDLVDWIRDLVIEASGKIASVGSNNVGGWKSDEHFLAWPRPCTRALLGEIESAIFQVKAGASPSIAVRLRPPTVGWAMLNRNGSQHKRHRHGLNYACGVWYATAGDPPAPTIVEVPKLEALCRVAQDGVTFSWPDMYGSCAVAIEPRPGRLVLFPGSYWHTVPCYDGAVPRISVAFEAR